MDEQYWKKSLEDEYKEIKELKDADVLLIQEWMKKVGHLPKLTDQEIILFLRASDFSLEKTKERIDLNYTMRTRLPELFSERNLDRKWLKLSMKKFHCGALPERDDNGNLILIHQIQKADLKEIKVEEITKLMFMIQDVYNLEKGSVPGHIFIFDLQNVTLGMLLQCSLSLIANSSKYIQEASTCILKGIHFVNGGNVIEKLFSLINPFLNDSAKQMIKYHANYDSLREAVNVKDIPSDFGGSGRSLSELHEDTISLLRYYHQWFDEEITKRVDEKKRTSNAPKDYGIQGSFRTLQVD